MTTESQCKRIRAYLERGGSLTPLKALKLFSCLRLGARILDLRAAGLDIRTAMVNVNGKRVARYYIKGVKQ